MNKKALNRELKRTLNKERKIIYKASVDGESFIQSKVNGILPGKIKNKLDLAFGKAFSLVYKKGSRIIMKTYSTSKMKDMYEEDKAFASIADNALSIRAFEARSRRRWIIDSLMSLGAGIGLGLIGRGIISIPVFVSITFRNIYQTALSYGYDPKSRQEQYLMLVLMNVSLQTGDDAEYLNFQVDDLFDEVSKRRIVVTDDMMQEQMDEVSKALSDQILYLKALQVIPVAGGVIGVTDVHFFNKIHKYIDLKYRKRFLLAQVKHGREN